MDRNSLELGLTNLFYSSFANLECMQLRIPLIFGQNLVQNFGFTSTLQQNECKSKYIIEHQFYLRTKIVQISLLRTFYIVFMVISCTARQKLEISSLNPIIIIPNEQVNLRICVSNLDLKLGHPPNGRRVYTAEFGLNDHPENASHFRIYHRQIVESRVA